MASTATGVRLLILVVLAAGCGRRSEVQGPEARRAFYFCLTDIWASGILLYRMICGRHPLHPLDGNQLVVTAMLELPMPSMTDAAPSDVPRELIQIVDRCLLKTKER